MLKIYQSKKKVTRAALGLLGTFSMSALGSGKKLASRHTCNIYLAPLPPQRRTPLEAIIDPSGLSSTMALKLVGFHIFMHTRFP